eukprot:jgi/Undpi1/1987/HiC_scaffold_12.g05374.m1
MEELQDAIEDVQYLQAVNSKDSGPSPTEPWPFPSEKALEEFNTESLHRDQQCYSLERICAGILGLYLVRAVASRARIDLALGHTCNESLSVALTFLPLLDNAQFGTFCSEMRELNKFEFILDVIRYRRLRTPNLRLRFAQGIIHKFLGDANTTHMETDVLVDKAPLRRGSSTPACLAELARVRSDTRTDGGAGVGRLGVIGPAVDRLVNLLLPTARASCGGDSSGPISGPSCRNGNDDKSGRCSQVDTADISDADNDDQPDGADVAAERRNMEGDALAAGEANEQVGGGNGRNHAPAKAAMLPGGNGTHFGSPRDVEATNGGQERARHQAATAGVTPPQGTGTEEYCSDLFDVLEAWVFEHLREKLHAGFLLSSHFQEYTRFLNVQHRPVTENDFILFRILGRGGFGAVNGCKRGASGKLFAMKVMNKRRIKIRQSEDLCWNERRILEALGSPFVVSLKYAFESKNDLFLILDLMTGGDLGFHLQQLGIFTPTMAQYYTARTVLGIRHLHQKGIVYRDLKPENVMLDEHGRSRISDMGLACKVTPHLTGACGTRGYWAPEMRLRNAAGKRVPYNECVDWFSLGCILYEFLRGMSPFRTERAIEWCADTIQDKEKRVDKATLEMEPEYPPKYFDDQAADLCSQLMAKDPSKRLGYMGADDILRHQWFGHLDLDALAMDQVESPYIPTKDINAAPQRAIGSFADAGSKVSLSREDQAIYEGWEYTCVDDFQQEVVDFLTYRDSHSVGFDTHGGGCCNVS